MLDELKERNILKLILTVRLACGTLDVRHPILEPLSQWRSIEAAGNERKSLVHADNARAHTAKLSTRYFNQNRMKPATPDFYLFGNVKRCLAGPSFEDADQLLAAVAGVLEGIEKLDPASGLSPVDGPIKEICRYQWRVY
jgi:hypothetical protein